MPAIVIWMWRIKQFTCIIVKITLDEFCGQRRMCFGPSNEQPEAIRPDDFRTYSMSGPDEDLENRIFPVIGQCAVQLSAEFIIVQQPLACKRTYLLLGRWPFRKLYVSSSPVTLILSCTKIFWWMDSFYSCNNGRLWTSRRIVSVIRGRRSFDGTSFNNILTSGNWFDI